MLFKTRSTSKAPLQSSIKPFLYCESLFVFQHHCICCDFKQYYEGKSIIVYFFFFYLIFTFSVNCEAVFIFSLITNPLANFTSNLFFDILYRYKYIYVPISYIGTQVLYTQSRAIKMRVVWASKSIQPQKNPPKPAKNVDSAYKLTKNDAENPFFFV